MGWCRKLGLRRCVLVKPLSDSEVRRRHPAQCRMLRYTCNCYKTRNISLHSLYAYPPTRTLTLFPLCSDPLQTPPKDANDALRQENGPQLIVDMLAAVRTLIDPYFLIPLQTTFTSYAHHAFIICCIVRMY